MCTAVCAFGEQVERGHDVIDAVGAEADTHATETGSAEYAREVVVASAAGDTAYGRIQRLDFDDGAGVVVEAASQRDIQVESSAQSEVTRPVDDRAQFLDALGAGFAADQKLLKASHTLVRSAGDVQYRLERIDGFG